MRSLRDHQADAARAARAALAGGGRATIVAAAGTGKTATAAEASRQIAPAGRVLAVAAPGQLALAAAEWASWLGRAAGRLITAGTAEGPGGPAGLARLLAGGGRVTVLCDYASLAVITAAHRDHGAPPWDLLIADDAHLAAAGGPAWQAIHHDGLIPAARRLYLTATPQVTDGRAVNLAGMDDQAVFGRVVHRTTYAAAARLGTAARYRVAAALVTSAEATEMAGARRAASVRTAAAHLAVLRAVTTWDLGRVITFHDQASHAARSAAVLGRSLERAGPADRPSRPLVAAIAAAPRDAAAPPAGHAEVISAVLPAPGALPPADAIALAGLRASQAGITSAVGRALHRRPGAAATVTVIVPVLLPAAAGGAGQPAGAPGMAQETFEALWKVVRALRAHDEELAAWLDGRRVAAAGGAESTCPPWLAFLGPAAEPGLAGAVLARMIEAATTSWPVNFAALRDFRGRHGHARIPDGYRAGGIDLSKWLVAARAAQRAGTLPPERAADLESLGIDGSVPEPGWLRGLAAAAAYHQRHGHLSVPNGHVTADGCALYTWLAAQRSARRRGALAPAQVRALDDLGICWDPGQDRWEASLAELRAYRDEHGHADVPLRHVTPAGLQLGHWVATCRRGYHAGTLPGPRARALEQLGITWDPAAAAWEHYREHLAAYVAGHGSARVPPGFKAPDGCALGRWVTRQRDRRSHPGKRGSPLTESQAAALASLGVTWHRQPAGTA